MHPVTLSYITSTKNKLPYLKDRISKLLEVKKDGEEILIADGGSTDGTTEYIDQLIREGKIEYAVSETDCGESHALNKLFLKARGELITLVTDDDVFYYPAIEACKKFMLANPTVDIIGTEGGFQGQDPHKDTRPLVYEKNYRQWQKDRTPFSFCGLGVMIRKSSVPLLGLWDTSFRRADAEFSFRVTAGKANIAWYTGYSFVNISNPQSVSLVYMKKIKDETNRLNKFYLNKTPDSLIVEKIKILWNKVRNNALLKEKKPPMDFRTSWPELSTKSYGWLDRVNKSKKAEFIWNE